MDFREAARSQDRHDPRNLIAYRMRNDHLVERLSERSFESDYGGQWRMITYRDRVAGNEAYVLQKGHVIPGEPTLRPCPSDFRYSTMCWAHRGRASGRCSARCRRSGNMARGVIVILTGARGHRRMAP